ncbi:hypothetical protein FB451DRAFT_1212213 [Mycena latifolia]|nr:hypothetical protein FB451DRAFT_1212213 [Mycena latifolia]
MSVEFIVFKGSASQGIIESKTHHVAPTGNQVLVRLKITHSGICGTDEHCKHADMVLGHEGVGTVQQVGESATGFNVGDVVGWGYTHKTYGTCEQSLLGQDRYCTDREQACRPALAPLMCGGATVFEVIESYNIRPTDRVGGIGGLGHLAIQFLAKMGASVVVFSSTESKPEEALRLGATEFYATKGVEKFEMGKLDHLLVTTSFVPNWNPCVVPFSYLRVMKPKSTIHPLTVSFGDLVIPSLPILVAGITIHGSAVAARSVHKRMLDFAARNHIEPIIERFPLTKSAVEEGMARLPEGKMRYRAVLVA